MGSTCWCCIESTDLGLTCRHGVPQAKYLPIRPYQKATTAPIGTVVTVKKIDMTSDAKTSG
jgi:hypothetical protein